MENVQKIENNYKKKKRKYDRRRSYRKQNLHERKFSEMKSDFILTFKQRPKTAGLSGHSVPCGGRAGNGTGEGRLRLIYLRLARRNW